MMSAVRATGAEITNTRPWLRSLQQLGMSLYLCQPPTGYADTADAWVSSGALVNRMIVALDLEKTRSHFDAQDYMESATPGVKNGTAGGRARAHLPRFHPCGRTRSDPGVNHEMWVS